MKDPWTYYLWWGIYWFEACILLLIVYPSSSAFNFWASLAGGVQAIAATLYLRAILWEEVSRVAAFLYLSPFFSPVFLVFLLDESIATTALLGIVLLVGGAFVMGSRERWKLSLSTGAKLRGHILHAIPHQGEVPTKDFEVKNKRGRYQFVACAPDRGAVQGLSLFMNLADHSPILSG